MDCVQQCKILLKPVCVSTLDLDLLNLVTWCEKYKALLMKPKNYVYCSAVCSDVDQNGIKHMILCRVLLGNSEQVKPGSEQFYPSSEEFDSGVDNKEKAGLYVMWGTHMNTHIFPEFVVSFKVPPPLQGK